MQTVHAPPFPTENVSWLNTPAPLDFEALRGRLVILDFWTFCCINCMHILPTLARIEEAFPEEVAVIGVHSPKFEAERDEDNVKAAIARYDIKHPVLHDPHMQTWQHYAVRAWPTLMFIDPQGYVLGQLPGEPDGDKLIELVTKLLNDARGEGTLMPHPLPAPPDIAAEGNLSFPGKVRRLPDDWQGPAARYAVADGGHHQIALLDDDGTIVHRYGNGKPGLTDQSFNAPQGLVASSDALFIADTQNHALRRIDAQTGEITTLSGIGKRGGILEFSSAAGPMTALASPWDLALDGDDILIANAGTHQLAAYNIAGKSVRAIAGNGGENIVDGPAADALLAQPSGLALSADGSILWFADSETSAIRALAKENGDWSKVETLVGTGLFDFGHINGPFPDARLQHALGVDILDNQTLLVADSYNRIMRKLSLADNQARDFGVDFTCKDDLCIPHGEPAGVLIDDDGTVLLSDTNNHRILRFDPEDQSYQTWAS